MLPALEKKIRDYITSLGTTTEAIVKSLEVQGIKGTPGNPRWCALACAIREQLRFEQMAVVYVGKATLNNEVCIEITYGIGFDGVPEGLVISSQDKALFEFVREFDRYAYKSIVDTYIQQ